MSLRTCLWPENTSEPKTSLPQNNPNCILGKLRKQITSSHSIVLYDKSKQLDEVREDKITLHSSWRENVAAVWFNSIFIVVTCVKNGANTHLRVIFVSEEIYLIDIYYITLHFVCKTCVIKRCLMHFVDVMFFNCINLSWLCDYNPLKAMQIDINFLSVTSNTVANLFTCHTTVLHLEFH